MFNVINLTEGNILTINEEPFTWKSGQEAKNYCDSYNRIFGSGKKILEPRKMMVEKDWRTREQNKYDTGVYILPDFLQPYNVTDHFLHLSIDKTRLAYTKDDMRGCQNIQTNISFMKYFELYHPKIIKLSIFSDLVDSWEIFLSGASELKIAMTPSEIIRVYTIFSRSESGLEGSCMRGSFMGLPMHPTGVYGAGDLGVAYLANKNNETVSRALVWPAKKLYSRVYGRDVLHRILKQKGYQKGAYYDRGSDNTFAGAKLLKVSYRRTFVMPYFDEMNLRAVDKGEFFILERWVDDNKSNTRFSNGLASSGAEFVCGLCGIHDDTINATSVLAASGNARHWCRPCAANYTFICQGPNSSGHRFENPVNATGYREENYLIRMENGQIWSKYTFIRHGFTCEKTGQNRSSTQKRAVNTPLGLQKWCSTALSLYGWTCTITGEHYSNEIANVLIDNEVSKTLQKAHRDAVDLMVFESKDGRTFSLKKKV